MSWLDFAEGTQGGIGQADIDRARAKGYSEQQIQAELARANQSGYKIGAIARSSMSNSTGMTPFEYDYQKAIDLANIQAQSALKAASEQARGMIGAASAQAGGVTGAAALSKEAAIAVADIDKQIKQMQLESAKNLQKLSNMNKLSLADSSTNQGILAGLVNAFNF